MHEPLNYYKERRETDRFLEACDLVLDVDARFCLGWSAIENEHVLEHTMLNALNES